MGSVSGADAGSVAPNDAGVKGDGGDAGCPVACNGQCHPKGTVCCTSESNCPNGNQVCSANGCVACGSPGTDGLACHAIGDCMQALKMCFD